MISTQEKQGLRVKSYFAASFQEAMKQAQQEMGHDALLLNSREAPPEARHLGAWEVVFGTTAEPAREITALKDVPPPLPMLSQPMLSQSTPAGDDILQHLHDIQALLKRLGAPSPSSDRGRNSAVCQALVDAGMDQTLAMDIEESVLRRVSKPAIRAIGKGAPALDNDSLMMETEREIAGRFDVKPEIGRITALVGPPGCGKTTTLVKLAVTEGLLARRTVRLISADAERIGAVEQLRTYAGILGVPFQVVETAEALAAAIDSTPSAALTLIDTPGFTNANLKEADAYAEVLKNRQEIDTHLVLPASMRSDDLKRTADRFDVFSPAKLLFTKLDETESTAAIFREAACRQKPLSFFTDGLLIPENIKPASRDQVVDALVRHLPEALRLVA